MSSSKQIIHHVPGQSTVKGTGYPQAINVHIIISQNGIPGVLGRDILDKALPTFNTLEEYEPVIKSISKPGLLGRDLYIVVIGNGATNMLFLQIILRYLDVFHFYDKLRFGSVKIDKYLRDSKTEIQCVRRKWLTLCELEKSPVQKSR